MADEGTEGPSLEPPRLFGGRRSAEGAAMSSRDDRVLLDGAVDLVPEPTPVAAPKSAKAPRWARLRRGPKPARLAKIPLSQTKMASVGSRIPHITGGPAAVLTGVLVGLVLVGLTLGGLRGCEAVQGTSSCGTVPGMGALAAIFALTIVVGRLFLTLFKVPDPGATSFLAVGLTSVIALIFLIGVLDTWPMAIVIPAITGATYLLSWWVTTTFVSTDTTDTTD